jgi:serine/threonine protein kinase
MILSPAQQLVGAVLNQRWRLLRLLGEGGMGAVFEAESLRGEGRRAVKVLHQEFVREQAVLSRFLTEATATRNLVHPNVAQTLDASTAEDGTPYIVMELLSGVPLGTMIKKGQGVSPQHAAPIVWGMLQALAAAHAQRIVHRDLKPDNIFLVSDASGQYVPKVLDFGIAKVMDAAGGMGSKTRTGVLLGTPGYMSPEQIRNSKGVDPRSDLWSVGVIFYEMLTGTPPFPADNEFARLTAVLTEEVKPVEWYSPDLAPWTPFFVRALAKDLTLRFQSADEMARSLSQIAHAGAPQSNSWNAISLPAQYQHQAQNTPTSRPAQTVPSKPPAKLASTKPSNMVGQGGTPPTQIGSSSVPTHVSPMKPPGTPTISTPAPPIIEVIDAPPQVKPGAAWWIVGVVAVVCLGLGFAAGYLVGGG